MRLPRLPYKGGKRRQDSVDFGGVNFSENFRDGEWAETENISCAAYPSVIPRAGRTVVSQEDGATAAYYFDGLGTVVGDGFYWDGVRKGDISPGRKQFAKVGDVLTIYPDKATYNISTGVYTAGVKASYTIPMMSYLRVERYVSQQPGPYLGRFVDALYFPNGESTQYVRTGNGERYEGRGQIQLNSYVTIADEYPGYGNFENLEERYVVNSLRELQSWMPDGYNTKIFFPDYERNPNEYYYILHVYKKQDALYWPDGNGRYIRREYWSFDYGTIDGGIYTKVGTYYVWSRAVEGGIYDEGIIQYNGKYLDEYKIGDIIAHEDGTNEYVIVETVKKTGFGMNANPFPIGNDHYYVEITTGVYEAEELDEPFNLASEIEGLTAGTKVLVTIGDTSVDATYLGVNTGNDPHLIFKENDLSRLSDKIGSVTIVPNDTEYDFDFVCSSGNRLWGVSGDTIYASKFGDPTDFTSADFISSDPWTAQVGSDGKWTGIIEYSGNVIAFKEDVMYVVAGTLPENYRVYTYNVKGVKRGCAETLCIINDVLYYYGIDGVYSYAGNTPRLISPNFGLRYYDTGAGGTDGTRYYLSLLKGTENDFFAYDTNKGIWIREEELDVLAFTRQDKLYALDRNGRFLRLGELDDRGYDTDAEGNREAFRWSMKSTPFYEGTFNHKYPSKLVLRMELYDGASFKVYMSYDGETENLAYESGTGAGHRIITVPIKPRRCDKYQYRIEGVGMFYLRGIAREYEEGSEIEC